MNPSLLYLHREDVSRALPPVRDLTDTVERAFALHARAGILTAPKGALVTARGDYFGSLTALSAELGYGCCQNTLSASREHAGDSHHIRSPARPLRNRGAQRVGGQTVEAPPRRKDRPDGTCDQGRR